MKVKRALTTLAVTFLAAIGVTTAYSPAASAASTVECFATINRPYAIHWFDCWSSNGTQTIWYINGKRTSEGQGESQYSFFCTYGRRYTIGVNLGTPLAATWSGYCDDLHG